LSRHSRSGASASSKFSKALVEIESTLHQSVMQSSAGSANADALRAVQTVADECAFWTEAAARDRRAGNSPAAFFARTLGKIAPRLSPAAIREQGRAEVARLVEDAQDACTALWRGDADDDETGGAIVARASASASSAGHVDAYPEARMVHVLSMIGRQLVWYWTDNLTRAHGNAASSASSSGASSSSPSTATGLLFDPLPEVRQSLAAALKVLAQWDGAVAEFMHAWTAGSGARWQGAKFADAGLQQMRARLRSLLRVRVLQAEVAALLPSPDERKRIGVALQRPLEQYVAAALALGGSGGSGSTSLGGGGGGNPLLMLGAGFEDSWQVSHDILNHFNIVTTFHVY
jgi:hypothetical protein